MPLQREVGAYPCPLSRIPQGTLCSLPLESVMPKEKKKDPTVCAGCGRPLGDRIVVIDGDNFHTAACWKLDKKDK